jgi:hypothetical protein
LYLKPIILPRQARDKHRENTQKRVAFFAGVGPEQLEEWYAERIQTEGRWRTFARINSDSGHACSSTLHAKALGSTYDQVWRYFFDYVKNGSLIREFASPSCCASKQATQPRNETGRQPACSQCLS